MVVREQVAVNQIVLTKQVTGGGHIIGSVSPVRIVMAHLHTALVKAAANVERTGIHRVAALQHIVLDETVADTGGSVVAGSLGAFN